MKYKIRKDLSIVVAGVTLYRIESLVNIPVHDVMVGDLGGFIQSKRNLDIEIHESAWVTGEAQVFGNAHVCGHSLIAQSARVFGNARVSGNARVFGNASIGGTTMITQYAKVFGNAKVFGSASVFGHAYVFGDAELYGSVDLSGYARIVDVELDESGQQVNISGYYHEITVTYANIYIGCKAFTLDELDTLVQHPEYTDREIDTIKALCESALHGILSNMAKLK